MVLNKRHLSTFTFRFRGEELERLDEIAVELNQGHTQKVSKNDIIRLSLIWLLNDYDQHKHTSVLTRVLTDE